MAGDEIEINIFCTKNECRAKIETVSVKKENMMLTSSEKIFCPSCNEDVTESVSYTHLTLPTKA